MRIIGGKYKHKRFDVPRSFKARPTTDFAKENLFNILSNVYFDFDDAPTALDLFAGTGSIGLEFLSRGCGKVISVEKDFQHYRFLTEVSKQMNDAAWKPVLADVFKYVERNQEKFDIIFADPPYTLEKLGDIPDIILGKDIMGEPLIVNLAQLPHLLVAGTTGSGKSVGVNAIILSLLYRNNPDDLKLMMIDPKQVEFAPYEDLPHLITPIINSPSKAIQALQAATIEMDKRYKILSEAKTKSIVSYNEKSDTKMPFFVIIIDELADLIMTGGKDAEVPIARIAQMGRAAGIHLIIATQRSSTNIVTGTIKANLPSRISYRVGNRIDSKVILDDSGAERLLGNGDGLFASPQGLRRIHAPWVSEKEIENVVAFIKQQKQPQYDESFLNENKSDWNIVNKSNGEGGLLEEAKTIILRDNKTSISYLQRKLGIGYNKAASLIESLENEGFLSAPNNKGERSIIS